MAGHPAHQDKQGGLISTTIPTTPDKLKHLIVFANAADAAAAGFAPREAAKKLRTAS